LFGAVKRVLLGVSRCLALQPDHTTLAPELPLPGYRRKETETVIAQLLEIENINRILLEKKKRGGLFNFAE
jgi:hypothetical protein